MTLTTTPSLSRGMCPMLHLLRHVKRSRAPAEELPAAASPAGGYRLRPKYSRGGAVIDPATHRFEALEEIDPAKGTWDILKQLKDDAKTATDTGLFMLRALVLCSTG